MAIDPNNRPIRVINDDTSNEEMEAGHHIPNADPPKNEAARGGFGNRDGKEGFGSDTSGGATAVGVNETADNMNPIHRLCPILRRNPSPHRSPKKRYR